MTRLGDYDWTVVNTSSGKDSQSILRFVMQQAEREGYPKAQIVCAHADLGKMEWPGTVDLAQRQAALYGVRFWKIARPQGDLLTHIRQRGKWPSSTARFCTSDHKRDQITKLFTELTADLTKGYRGRRVRILSVMGMRAEESPARSKLKPFTNNARASSGIRHVDTWLPIHEWKLGDVWKDIKASGIPYHKAYDLGMPRLSCVFCIFSPPAALMLAGKNNPELLDQYVEAEKAMGHTFRKGKATDWVM